MKLFQIAICILILFPTLSTADNKPIKGAFGLYFGNKLDIDKYKKISVEKSGGIKYQFAPSKPYGLLDKYYVFATPETHRIYKIVARGSFKSKSICKAELSNLEQALSTKYGKKIDDISSAVSGIPTIRIGKKPRRIVAVCLSLFGKNNLILTYLDDNLNNKAKEENAETENKKRDTSGL